MTNPPPCHGLTAIMYPNLEIADEVARAKAVCRGCHRTFECAANATTETHGIWAGTTPNQRTP